MTRYIFLWFVFVLSFSFGQGFSKDVEASLKRFGQAVAKYEKSKKAEDLIRVQKDLRRVFGELEKYVENHAYVERLVLIRYSLRELFNLASLDRSGELQQVFYQALESSEIAKPLKSDVYFILYDFFASKAQRQADGRFLIKQSYELDPSSLEKKFFYARDILLSEPQEAVRLFEEIINDPYVYGNVGMIFDTVITLASYFDGRDADKSIEYYEKALKISTLKTEEKLKVYQSLLRLYADTGAYPKVADVAKKIYDLTKIQDFLEVYMISSYVSTDEITQSQKNDFSSFDVSSSKNVGRKTAIRAILAYDEGEKEKAVGLVSGLGNNDGLQAIAHLLLFKFTLLESLERENEEPFLKLVDYFRSVKNEEAVNSLLERRQRRFGKVDIDGYIRGLLAFSKRDFVTGMNDFKTALDKGAGRIEKVMQNIDFYGFLQTSEKEAAIDVLNKITKDKYSSVDGLHTLAILYEETKDYKKQLSTLKKLLSEGNDSPEVRYALLRVYDQLNDMKNMKTSFEKLVEDYPFHAEYYNYYAYALIEKKENLEEAMRAVEKSLKFDPENIFYLDTHAWGYFAQGDYEEAKKVMDKILPKLDKKNAQNGEFYYHAAKIEGALQNPKEEKEYMDLSKELGYKEKN